MRQRFQTDNRINNETLQWISRSISFRRGQPLQFRQDRQSLFPAGTAHFGSRPQRTAHRRTLRRPKDPTAELPVQIHAGDSGGLAFRHSRNRRRNRRCDAAGAAPRTAFKRIFHDTTPLFNISANPGLSMPMWKTLMIFSEKNVLSLDIRNLFWYNKRDDKTFA